MKKFLKLILFLALAPMAAFAYDDAVATQFPGDIEVTDLKLSGNDIVDSAETTRITVGATNAIVGNLTVTGNITPATGQLGVVVATETIASAATITANACGGIKRIQSTGAVTTGTTNTFTAPSASLAGCIMYLKNVDDTDAITLDTNTLFKSAGAANVVLAAGDTIIVGTDGTFWYQFSALLDN
jgi:hypothetical protein